jgi:DNA-binding ferritin-like protein
MAKEPRAVRKAREALGTAYQRQEDTADNYAEMRRALRGTAQAHQAVRSENRANRSAAKGVRNAEAAVNKAVEKAAAKAAKKNRGR